MPEPEQGQASSSQTSAQQNTYNLEQMTGDSFKQNT
jgi:hypothetical protein